MDLIEFLIKAAEHTKSLAGYSYHKDKYCSSNVVSQSDDRYSLDIQMPISEEIFCYEQGKSSYGGQLLVSKNPNGYHQTQGKGFGFSHLGQQIPEGTKIAPCLEPYAKIIKERGHRAIVKALLGS
jgi:hypothetical protein